MPSISERSAEAEDRAVPGHWEGDLYFGSHNSQIATLVERQTRYLMLVRVASKETETVVAALIEQAHKLPRELYKSLTWDRGKEMADPQCHRSPAERTAPKDTRLRDTGRTIWPMRCVDRLNPQPRADVL